MLPFSLKKGWPSSIDKLFYLELREKEKRIAFLHLQMNASRPVNPPIVCRAPTMWKEAVFKNNDKLGDGLPLPFFRQFEGPPVYSVTCLSNVFLWSLSTRRIWTKWGKRIWKIYIQKMVFKIKNTGQKQLRQCRWAGIPKREKYGRRDRRGSLEILKFEKWWGSS